MRENKGAVQPYTRPPPDLDRSGTGLADGQCGPSLDGASARTSDFRLGSSDDRPVRQTYRPTAPPAIRPSDGRPPCRPPSVRPADFAVRPPNVRPSALPVHLDDRLGVRQRRLPCQPLRFQVQTQYWIPQVKSQHWIPQVQTEHWVLQKSYLKLEPLKDRQYTFTKSAPIASKKPKLPFLVQVPKSSEKNFF